ncbi:hypothetical protein PCASD_02276 [Puccinia coronata f. sp. avenae]|uniref:Phenylalanine ammonia-lyase n=1 Tax=Puccinia coronata f. sp. avenae TaxID=200324 RepID=A0A2N5VIE3_9BASI|nr:hypothetical protein PCASD_02276 [Puccinia coronata f. sp. avenae]
MTQQRQVASGSPHTVLAQQLISPLLLNHTNSKNPVTVVTIDGHSLSIEQLIRSTLGVGLGQKTLSAQPASTTTKNAVEFQLTNDRETIDRINESLQFMRARTGESTYGVTTGFGAAATTRTRHVQELQVSIVEHLLAGITGVDLSQLANQLKAPIHPSQPLTPNVMPESIVRAAILIRVNSLTRGHSAVRLELLHGLLSLLNLSITPVVPLRGTISASGDLAPLAYVAGALCAHPDVYVIDRSLKEPKVLSSAECLKAHGITPLVLGPKEGLAIANGTAFSAAAASMAMFQAHTLGLLSQVLTAMTVEAMVGQIGAFHPFIHQTARPHAGQIEVAKNIYRLLQTSQLLESHDEMADHDLDRERSKQILRQDRYPLRTAPQWIGPQLEDLLVAHQAIAKELNSTTDNPLVDVENGILHHGGNFQATSVATSMEKTRLAIAAIGKIIFAQVTELNNSFMNKGLPSCLNGHEPSTNYHTKGLDTSCAAYCAELQYLAGPVTTHVQSAEGHNQSINSLAFISARKTLEAIEILKMLMASHLYCLCQALDLRVLEIRLKNKLSGIFSETVEQNFGAQLSKKRMDAVVDKMIDRFWFRREMTASLDTKERVRDGLEGCVAVVMEAYELEKKQMPVGAMASFLSSSADMIAACLEGLRAEGIDHKTVDFLGGTRPLYEFVRNSLGIRARRGDVVEGTPGPTIGGMVNKIFRSLQFELLPTDQPQQFLQVLLSLFESPPAIHGDSNSKDSLCFLSPLAELDNFLNTNMVRWLSQLIFPFPAPLALRLLLHALHAAALLSSAAGPALAPLCHPQPVLFPHQPAHRLPVQQHPHRLQLLRQQDPSPDQLPARSKKTIISHQSSSGDYSDLRGGFASVSLVNSVGLWISIQSPNLTKSWDFQLGVSKETPLHALNGFPAFKLDDTDDTNALMTAADPSLFQPLTDKTPLSLQQFVPMILPTPDTLQIGLSGSLCYLQSLVAAQSQDFKTHVAQLSITSSLTTRTTGAGSFSSQPTGNATDHDYRISDQAAGLRTQYLINNLRPALNYSAWLFQPGPLVDNVQTGKLWPYINFRTKISKNCRLVHDLPFCPSVAYAVPSSPSQTTSSLIDMYNQTVSVHLANFRTVVSTYPCNNDTSGRYSFVTGCGDCLRAYTDWVCAVGMPRCTDAPARPVVAAAATETQVVFTRTEPSASRTPNMTDKSVYPYAELPPCASLCTLVAATCPPLIGWTCPLPGVSLGSSYRDSRPLSPLELSGGHQSLAGFGGDRAQDRFGNVFCNALESDIVYARMGSASPLRISVQTLASLLVAQSFFFFFLLLA